MKIILTRLCLVVFLLGILLPANALAVEARSARADMLLPTDWTATGAMKARRAYFTLSVLPDGKALAAGGYYYDESAHYLNSSEIYDPLTNTWTMTGNSMSTARRKHTATVLLDGRVLVAGGQNSDGTIKTAEIYDPATGLWTTTGSMTQQRYGHTATRLQDGRVLVVGGCFTTELTSACTIITEIYDPVSGTWQSGAYFPTGQARMNHTATLLQDGSVLVAGGYRVATSFPSPAVAKTYNNAYRLFSGGTVWVDAGTMTAAPQGRSEHSAVVRRDGKVLIVGGYYSSEISNGYVASTEIYDPNASTNQWTNLGKPLDYGQRSAPSVLDANGSYILLGGEFNGSSSDIYYMDINKNNPPDTWHRLFGDLPVQRSYHAAAVLPGGVILVAGGRDVDGSVVNSAETNRFTSGVGAVGDLRSATFGFYRSSATLMPNGDVMITGGSPPQGSTNPTACHNLVSYWDFQNDTFPEPGPAMIRPRCGHSTILLPDGRVLVLGGATSVSGGASGTGEIFDGTSWTRLTVTGLTFEDHKAVLLPNGTVLVMEGSAFDANSDDVYIFDPVDLSFRLALNQPTGTYNGFTLTLMKNGKVLILGSKSSETVEVFDPVSETFTTVPSPSPLALFNNHDAVLLPDGRVMVSGGQATGGYPRQETYFFDPQTNGWKTGPMMISGRHYHQMLVLPDGRPVVIGGMAKTGAVNDPATTKIEIYDPRDDAWHSAGDLLEARRSHETLLTLTGQILIIGGLDEFNNPLMNVERFRFPNISTSSTLWKPTVTQASCVNCNGNRQIELTGSDFTAAWEGSSGLTNQSAANQPLVQLIRLDNGQMEWLRPEQVSDTGYLSKPIPGFPDGPAMVFVYVNGSFQGKVVMINDQGDTIDNKVYLPMLRK